MDSSIDFNYQLDSDADKYNKVRSKGLQKHVPEPLTQYLGQLGVFNAAWQLTGYIRADAVPVHIFMYLWFVLATGFGFILVGGVFEARLIERFAALQLEILGLVLVRHQIKSTKSVRGISGMAFMMYAVVYFCRFILGIPFTDQKLFLHPKNGWKDMEFSKFNFEWKNVDFDVTLGFCSLLLVIDILMSIFRRHRKTYQAEFDMLKAPYVIAACFATAMVVRPHFEWWPSWYGYWWGATMYADMFALMPQVVMMAMSGGKVQSPIANFVALTSISRVGDLVHSWLAIPLKARTTFSTTFWLAVGPQIVCLLLVADFMYYFCKARSQVRTSAEGDAGGIEILDV